MMNSGCGLVVTLLLVVCLDVLGALSSANDRTTVDIGNVRLPGLSTRFNKFAEYCLHSQQIIARDLSRVDGRSKVLLHPWERFQDVDRREHLEGYGVTGVIEDGDVVEKGAVSVTVVRGQLTAERAASIRARQHRSSNSSSDEGSANSTAQIGRTYCAAALSIVLHSRSPFVPTFRADVRYFEVEGEEGWFGGGADLTPSYLFDEDAKHFHGVYRRVCADFGPTDFHQRLKRWCDEYFYLPSRGEHRGVGGIFFDDLQTISGSSAADDDDDADTDEDSGVDSSSVDQAMSFTCAVCNAFMDSYLPIVDVRRGLPFTAAQKHWQLIRRGRYVEFNLLFDRGVRFGLQVGRRVGSSLLSAGEREELARRTEAVLISCPPLVAWEYSHVPAAGSEEARLLAVLRDPKDW